MAIPVMILVVLVIVGESSRADAFRRWEDDSFEQNIPNLRDDCSNDDCVSMMLEKRGEELEEVGGKTRGTLSRVLPSYRVTGRPWLSCPCETQYDIIDLGLDNYPRYLASARCAAKTCHNKFNPCRLIHYKVHILRQRDTSIESDGPDEQQQYVEQIVLPESLRVRWQMKPVKIAVACVSNDGKKN